MNIIDHLSLGAPCIDKAAAFYDGLLETLSINCLAKSEAFVAYGQDRIQFLLLKPENQEAPSTGNGTHICFVAPSQEAVKHFHAHALAHGGECAGEPGPREAYPIPDVYTTFVRDPFGNKLEAIFNGFDGV
ncbi:VOC family protein [Pseudoteredinibacter isoporae]|uniref:VOC family protein n=1 Tax=Pseudoteredinibacter isoporae TaxID=570281 RepID=UPI00310A5B93